MNKKPPQPGPNKRLIAAIKAHARELGITPREYLRECVVDRLIKAGRA